MHAVPGKSLTTSDWGVVVVLLAILAIGPFVVLSGYADPSFLLGLLVLDGCVFGLYAAFKGTVQADVASFGTEIGATTPQSVWPRIVYLLFIFVTGVFVVDAIIGGLRGTSTPLTAAIIASLGILLIVVSSLASHRAKFR